MEEFLVFLLAFADYDEGGGTTAIGFQLVYALSGGF